MLAAVLAAVAVVVAALLAVKQWAPISRLRHLRRNQHIGATDVTAAVDGTRSERQLSTTAPRIVGFFHPYCNSGGGGERVLWALVRLVHELYPHVHCVVYTGDVGVSPEQIIRNVQERFGIALVRNVDFITLRRRNFVEASWYPRMTLMGQSFGACVIGAEAFTQLVPDIFFDTMGYTFTYPLMKLAGCKVLSYTHYPTISTDMLALVERRETAFNNQPWIASSPLLSRLKTLYYDVFAEAYGFCGRFADLIMVNSTWTKGHIDCIWQVPHKTQIVFPPCNTEQLEALPLAGRSPIIVSVAQFRPEKNHVLQLQAFHIYLTVYAQSVHPDTKLVLIGGCRNDGDRARVTALQQLAADLQITDRVEFVINATHTQLMDWLGKAMIGLHSMRDEHFGIGVVEYMAAGLVAVAHKSGGPLMDIVKESTPVAGFLADSAEAYAQCFHKVMSMQTQDISALQIRGRESAQRFSERAFSDTVRPLLAPYFDH